MTTTRPGGRPSRIYHLIAAASWRAQQDAAEVATGQLARHGFIHCCTREQIVEIASWWLKDDAPLVALEIDHDRIPAGTVRFERPEGETREYPHVYGPLPRDTIVDAHQLGTAPFALPTSLADPPPCFTIEGRLDGKDVRVTWQAGELVDAPPDLAARANVLVDKGAPVKQFLDVSGTASLASPYDAFSLLVELLDDITCYRGDGFEHA